MKLSERLNAVAYMIPTCDRIADIGTDHAFLPIQMVSDGEIPSAIAVDINEGPLEIARTHIAEAGLTDKIECRLGDGITCISPDEADTVVIAGMGGDLITGMISSAFHNYVLCPHSHAEKVRHRLCEEGFVIEDEDMVLEDGKFYPVIQAAQRQKAMTLSEEQAYFGPVLLAMRHPVLKQFLEKEKEKFSGIPQKEEYLCLVENALRMM